MFTTSYILQKCSKKAKERFLNANYAYLRFSESAASESTLKSTKNQEKQAELHEQITKKTTKTEKMVGEMTIKVIRSVSFSFISLIIKKNKRNKNLNMHIIYTY